MKAHHFPLFGQNLMAAYQIRFLAKSVCFIKKNLKIKVKVGKFPILKGVYINKLCQILKAWYATLTQGKNIVLYRVTI